MKFDTPASETAPQDGLTFGSYVATRELGRGGMSVVHEARHPRLDKRVAVKVMHRSLAGDPIACERFVREAQAIARVAHPHVVEVLDVGFDEGRPYIVMERLEGETLEALLRRQGRLPVASVVELFMPVLSAVAAIHDGAVTHRDLKPGNVILARRGRFAVEPVVLDFGVSRCEDQAAPQVMLTDPNVLVGTLPYLSPEQLRDARSAGPGGDQYAIGVMLYECLTGQRPFASADRYELMHAVMTATVAPPSALDAAVPRDLDLIVLRAMSRNPTARFPSIRALGSALLSFGDRSIWKRWAAEFAGGDANPGLTSIVETEADVRSTAAMVRPRQRRRRVVASGVMGGAVLAFGTLALVARGARAPSPAAPVAALAALAAPKRAATAPASLPAAAPATKPTPSTPTPPSLLSVARRAALARPIGGSAPAPSSSPSSSGAGSGSRAASVGAASLRAGDAMPARARRRRDVGDNDAIDPFQPLR